MNAIAKLDPTYAPPAILPIDREAATTGGLIERRKTDQRKWKPRWRRRAEDDWEDGQTLAEYALIIALIAVVAIVALYLLGGAVSDTISKLGNSI